MATGILLRRDTKANLVLSPPVVGELVFSTDTEEIGQLINGSLLWTDPSQPKDINFSGTSTDNGKGTQYIDIITIPDPGVEKTIKLSGLFLRSDVYLGSFNLSLVIPTDMLDMDILTSYSTISFINLSDGSSIPVSLFIGKNLGSIIVSLEDSSPFTISASYKISDSSTGLTKSSLMATGGA